MARGSTFVARVGLACLCALAGCAPPPVTRSQQGITGKDGDKTIAGTETVNNYTALALDAVAGDTSLNVADASAFSAGDLILVVASQGASIDTTDAATYGTVSTLGAAGQHELWILKAVDTGTNVLTLDPGCGLTGLSAAYPLTARPQVIRVPQYRNLKVPFGTSLTGLAWNGSTGGYVVVHIEDTATIDGTIVADSLGFRGGAISPTTAALGDDVASYRTTAATGGEKGEGIAGTPAEYDALLGRYGRGAPANAGGGGNGYLSGGGGGAGFDAMSASPYSGQGTMAGSVAWSLDPGVSGSGGPGGGRGGYTLSALDLDATVTPPGDAAWGGNSRAEHGGLGGHAVPTAGKLFLGGGGGAGSYDGPSAGTFSGGRGGGVVYLMAGSIAGTGGIRADGQDGAPGTLVGTGNTLTVATGGGSGGGGGGGMVVVRGSGAASLGLSARGGNGGSGVNAGSFGFGITAANGPGGGGAGGGVVLGAGVAPSTTPDVTGGTGGTTSATAVAEFPANGATTGDSGNVQSGIAQSAAPRACLPADLAIQLTDSLDPVETGSGYAYSATIKNNGPNAAYDISVAITAPSGMVTGGVTAAGWTCAQVGLTLTCTRALLASGGTSTVVWAMVAPATEGTYTASATVSSREDPASGNNSDSESTVVQLPQADLSLTIDAPVDTASNEPFVYTMKVTNEGPRPAPSLQVVNTLPAGVTYQSSTGAGWSCAAAGATVTCTHGPLANGSQSSVDLSVIAPALTTDTTLSDHATVSLTSSGAHDPDASNDLALVDVIVHPVDLSLTKTDAADPVGTSASITYTLTIANPAVVAAHGVVVQDTLPAGTSFISAGGTGWTCSLAASVIGCTRTTAFANPIATPAITVVLLGPTSAGMVTNSAVVSATATDPVLGNNTASQTTTIVPPSPGSADLSVALVASASSVPIGTPIVYTVSVGNAGPDPASSAQVQIVFPSDLILGMPTGSGWTCTTLGTTITCTPIGKLALGAAPEITIPTTAPSHPSGVSVTATVSSTTPDPVAGNDHATAETQVVDPAVVNDPPVLLLPSALSTEENVPLIMSDTLAPQVSDPDAGTDDLELRVDASVGAFTLAVTDGLTFLVGDGILDPHLVVRGPQSALNAALAGCLYTPDPGFFGAVALAFVIDDLGHTGTGGPQQSAATVAVTVSFVDSPPIPRDDEASVPSDRTTRIDVLANDESGDPGQGIMLVKLTQPEHGKAAIVAGAVLYTPDAKYLGDDTLEYTCSDGNGEASAHVRVHVVPDTSPPIDTYLGGGGVGCDLAPVHANASTAAWMLLLGIGALLVSARRRARETNRTARATRRTRA